MGKIFVDTVDEWTKEVKKREDLYKSYQNKAKILLENIEKDNSYENQKALCENIKKLDESYLDIENVFFNKDISD